MDELTKQVLRSFAVWQKDILDLHELFEVGGNDSEARTAVFDTVERLVREGLLEYYYGVQLLNVVYVSDLLQLVVFQG